MFQRSGGFALRHEDRALVRGGEIVAYLLQLGQEPVFRAPRKSESARSQRVIFRIFHQPARFFHRLHVGDDDAPRPEIQRVEHGGARGITHAHKRLRAVEFDGADHFPRALIREGPVFRIDDDIIQAGQAQAFRHGGAAQMGECAHHALAGGKFLVKTTHRAALFSRTSRMRITARCRFSMELA